MLDWMYPPKPVRLLEHTSGYAKLLTDEGWVLEPKLDGYRCLTWLEPGGVKPFTRQGAELAPVSRALDGATHHERVVLDGEWYKDVYHVFDLAYVCGTLDERRTKLVPIIDRLADHFPVQLMPRWDKLGAYARALADGLEGIVLKHRSHVYGLTTNQSTTPLWRKVKP